jgi:hypothetical protein
MRWGWPAGGETEWHRCIGECHLGKVGETPSRYPSLTRFRSFLR